MKTKVGRREKVAKDKKPRLLGGVSIIRHCERSEAICYMAFKESHLMSLD